MILCTHCSHPNREGSFFCEACGMPLGVAAAAATKRLDSAPLDMAAKATWGTARFGEDAVIILRIRDVPDPIKLEHATQVILGRADSTSTSKPDVDLTPYNALEKGVSRTHAAIRRSDDNLTLTDLGSANGTHLNGQRLIPEQPRLLRDGDEIRLGKLVAHIYFR